MAKSTLIKTLYLSMIKYEGVHVIDNSNPQQPQKISFINIPRNVDISVKDGFLYADSLMDQWCLTYRTLTPFNKQIGWKMCFTILFSFLLRQILWYNHETDVLVGWKTVTERRLV